MKQTLQLKLSQHLTLTPQLQQSIRLLQLSTLELNQEVERLLQENPLLEKADDDEAAPPPPEHALSSTTQTKGETSTGKSDESPPEEIEMFATIGSDGDWGPSSGPSDDDD